MGQGLRVGGGELPMKNSLPEEGATEARQLHRTGLYCIHNGQLIACSVLKVSWACSEDIINHRNCLLLDKQRPSSPSQSGLNRP